jgi:hypothetical protein
MRIRSAIVVACVAAAAAVAALAVPAGAGNGGYVLTIEKVVVGELPPGTEFVVNVFCVDSEQNGSVDVVEDLTFPGDGSDTVFVPLSGAELPVTCTVTETDDGGATSVAYACEDDPGATECTAENVIEIFEPGEDSTITVTNTFAPPEPPPPPPPPPPPEPAQAVAAGPRFTG